MLSFYEYNNPNLFEDLKCKFKKSSLLCWDPFATFVYFCLNFYISAFFKCLVLYEFSFRFNQFSSVTQSCLPLCDPMKHSTPGLPVHHQLPESTQIHVHRVGDAIQPPHPLSSPSSPALTLSQHQGLFKCVSSSHQVAKVLEFQLQHQSFQWTPRTHLL